MLPMCETSGAEPMELIEIGGGIDPHEALESGNILYFPSEGSGITDSDSDKELLLSIRQTNNATHKNIAYRPLRDKLSGYDGPADALRSALRRYSKWAVDFT